jgi:hypothetical protein
MPRQDPLEGPRWATTPAGPVAPMGFVVDLDEDERVRSREARERRGETRDPLAGALNDAEDVATFVRQIVAGVFRVRLIVPIVVLMGVGLALIQAMVWLTSDPARERHALGNEALIDELSAEGADRAVLQALYEKWNSASGPERTEAALLLIDQVDREAGRLGVGGSDPEQWRLAAAAYRQQARIVGE